MQNQNSDEVDFTSLIQELGIDKMPREEQEKVLSDILDAINLRVLTRISEGLPEEEHKQLKERIVQNPEQAQQIVLSLVSKEQQVKMFQEEIEAVKKELKEDS